MSELNELLDTPLVRRIRKLEKWYWKRHCMFGFRNGKKPSLIWHQKWHWMKTVQRCTNITFVIRQSPPSICLLGGKESFTEIASVISNAKHHVKQNSFISQTMPYLGSGTAKNTSWLHKKTSWVWESAFSALDIYPPHVPEKPKSSSPLKPQSLVLKPPRPLRLLTLLPRLTRKRHHHLRSNSNTCLWNAYSVLGTGPRTLLSISPWVFQTAWRSRHN